MSAAGRGWIAGLLGVTLAAVLCLPASAQTLYGSRAPKDSAYVRVFRVPGQGSGRALVLGSTRFEQPDPGGVTPYRPVSPDIYQIRSDGKAAEIIPRARRYYTIALTRRGVKVYEDPAHEDPARSQLVLYNLGGLEQVGLSTEDGKTRVIGPLAPGEAQTVLVNSVPVRLGVFAGGGLLDSLGDLGLERGSSYSVFVFEQEGGSGVQWAEARLALD